MKHLLRLLIVAVSITFLNSYHCKAQDTIHVQCFTYGSSQDSTFLFPSDTVRIQKILMNYKLRCPFASQCGEWDYLTYTYLFQPTGKLDSVSHSNPTFLVNGLSIDTFPYMNSPSYSYHPYFENFVVHQNTISFDSTIISANTININHPYNASLPVCRSQYVWKASELTTAGMSSGNISGVRFYVQSAGSAMNHLIVRLKSTTLDSITTGNYEKSGFTTVYDRTTTFTSTGWNTIEFTEPFNWNGTSNLVFDFCFQNESSGTPTVISGSNSSFQSGITTSCVDRSLFFEGLDNISVPNAAFAALDSQITVSFWSFGNPAYQPQNQSIFEGTDSLGQRVINCHLPWSDGIIYWDAGNSGTTTYDRLSKLDVAASYKSKWTHWAFTKNTTSGKMKIYQNGIVFNQAFSKRRLMKGIKNFKIGSFADGSNNYDGYVDDFSVFNKELDQATIQQWMYKKTDSSHPYYSNLLFNYDFDSPSFTTAFDSSSFNQNGHLAGIPVSSLYTPTDIFKNLINTTERPDIIFEQGVYMDVLDSVMHVDSIANAPLQVVYYSDDLNPSVPTDTQFVYPAYYSSYQYDVNEIATDSTWMTPDSILYLDKRLYWDPPYEVNNRFEIGRYITPYGNSLSLGNGFNWVYDVSDYRTLLHDSVHLAAGNWQELLDLSFDMIKGIPPRDPISVENIYPGGDFWYGLAFDPIENHFPPKYVQLDSAANFRIKYRSTGHGEDGNNCDEFCPKTQSINVNGIQRFSQVVWKDDCALNPLYPQGGTWPLQRANWCPGDDVPTYDYELTPYVTASDSALIDVNFQPYTTVASSSGNSWPHCVVETQLIKYNTPNFTLDAAVYDIKTPSNQQIYQRHNPICNNPLITIENTGTTTLTSLTITYGQVGGTQSIYNWTGNIPFLKKADVQLGNMIWNGTDNIFTVTVSNPNGGIDEYNGNNTMTSAFTIPPQLDNASIFELKTNSEAYQNAYALKDDQGNTVFARSGLSSNTTYSDTLYLPNGCYEFKLTDSGEDGLDWWANPSGGSGTMKIKRMSDGVVQKNFGTDFGAEIYFQFTAGYMVGIKNIQDENNVHIYPNPTTGKINFDFNFSKRQDAWIEIYNATGTKIYSEKTGNILSKNSTADLSLQPAGIYSVAIRTDDRVYHSKIVLTK